MNIENPSTSSKVCPTCGTRVSQSAPRCLVCGTEMAGAKTKARTRSVVQSNRMPEVTVSLPVILGMLALFIVVGGALTYLAIVNTVGLQTPEPDVTITPTPTASATGTPVTPTATFTPQPSPTPQTYRVQPEDTCSGIAFLFKISVQAIVLMNNLSADCSLSVGMELRIPAPTPTQTPIATTTLTNKEATRDACEVVRYTVVANDSLSQIAEIRGVPVEAIMDWNGLTTSNVFLGQVIEIPLCLRVYVQGQGTVTPSPAPPYPAPELLLPVDGEAFTLANDTVVLQWSAVGTLRDNEAYQVTVIDVTADGEIVLVEEVVDTKFIIPTTLRPTDGKPHIFRWFVLPVARVGVDEDNNPVWVPGGAISETWAFTWSGEVPQATPQP
ncbi:MAG: LysM peptidoglycan-binding domain-containing protein [Anaerolineae bacterium]|nr:LysM peptidoglycan-binding domain-containing protein [Anaerolineae bacterium]